MCVMLGVDALDRLFFFPTEIDLVLYFTVLSAISNREDSLWHNSLESALIERRLNSRLSPEEPNDRLSSLKPERRLTSTPQKESMPDHGS